MENQRTLQGIKVVELSTFVAAPVCARMLADMGADVVKIVTKADDDRELLDCFRAITLLKENLSVPFLFLAGGSRNALIRRIGPNLGCCMYLCVYEHDEYSTKAQPLLSKVKAIRDNMEW